MTDAREIINAACINVNQWRDQTYASAVINALTAAGFRILGPDEVKIIKESLERINKNSNGCSKSDIILASRGILKIVDHP